MNVETFWVMIGAIIAVLGLAGSVIVHLVKTTWAMAEITTTVKLSFEIVNATLKEIKEELAAQRVNCVQQKDCIREMSRHEESIKALWAKYDKTKIDP